MNHHPKICLENFRKAKRNSDETFLPASRLTSMWLYYLTYIGVLQGEEWYKPRDLGKQCDIFYASKGKSYDEPERAKWNDSEKRSFNGSWGKQPFGGEKWYWARTRDKASHDPMPITTLATAAKDLMRIRCQQEGTELVDGTVAARVDVLGKVIPRLGPLKTN
ncbi:hypothetical protein TNCV_1208831 [Trichonephila clavipes]|nr:hypothetical protein TNCV_1208831 [Trichonephila clavipes]